MRYKEVKKESETKGWTGCLQPSVEFKNGSPISVTFWSHDGAELKILANFGYLTLLVPEPPEKVKVWHLTGSLAGLPVDEEYDSLSKAEARKAVLEDSFYESAGRLTITETEEEKYIE